MKKTNYFLLTIIFIYLFIRLYQLPQRVNFSMEPGMLLLQTFKMWQEKKLTLISISSSFRTKAGLSFFHGPWILYSLLPFMLISNWNPLAGSYLFILANLLTLIFLFKAIEKRFNLNAAILAGIIFSLTPNLIHYSRFIWNPNFLPLTSAIIIYFGVNLKKPKWYLYFLAGIILGFSLGWHYQAIIVAIIASIYLLIKRVPWKYISLVLLGFLIGFSPFIIFELRHNFYNLKIISSILKEGSNKQFTFPPHFYYFLSLIPFIVLIVSLCLEKVFKKNKLIGSIILLGFIIYSLIKIIPQPNAGYTMPEGWNYPTIKKTAQIILEENKKDYNIANILYGDTRAHALRYLLTVKENPPLSVEIYPQADYLFIISRKNKQETMTDPVWEISSFLPRKLIKTWKIDNKINLYLLEKVKNEE